MLFRRRVELRPLQKLREHIWPSAGWKRTFLYGWRRIWRLSGTPHAIALGIAIGVFAAFTPFLGLHIVIALLIAWVVRGNFIAAATGTFIGTPFTFPPMWFATYRAGSHILALFGIAHPEHAERIMSALTSGKAFDMILPVILPMTIGAVPVGGAFAAATYFGVRIAVGVYQARRRERLAERANMRAAAHAFDPPQDNSAQVPPIPERRGGHAL